MSASLLESLRSAAPVPKIVLLPDACFFVRSIPVTELADASAVESQVELALETISPFPVAQLLHGFHWVSGSTHALVFAAYRRRFSADEVDAWAGADWVAPAFCTLLARQSQPGTTVLYSQGDSMTALHWGAGPVPEKVLNRPLPPDSTEEQKQSLRDELLREIGGTRHTVILEALPEIQPVKQQGDLIFLEGTQRIALPESLNSLHDIRPSETLDALSRARRNNLMLWRGACGLVAVLGLLALGEVSLFGMGFVESAHQLQVRSQQGIVAKIEGSHALSFRIDELATKRLLPFEMITQISEKKPKSIQFIRTTTGTSNPGIQAIRIEARTSNPADLSAYQTALSANPAISNVEVSEQNLRDRNTTFTLIVTFKPEALKPSVTQG